MPASSRTPVSWRTLTTEGGSTPPWRSVPFTLLAVGLASCSAELPTHSELPDHPVDEAPTTTTPAALFLGGDCPAAWNCAAVDGSVRSH